MNRSLLFVLGLGFVVLACGAQPDGRPSIALEAPSGDTVKAAGPVAVVHGKTENVDALSVALTVEGTTHTFEMAPGRRLVFVAQPESDAGRRVAWPGERAPMPKPASSFSDATRGTFSFLFS